MCLATLVVALTAKVTPHFLHACQVRGPSPIGPLMPEVLPPQRIAHDSTNAEPPFPGFGSVEFGGTPKRCPRQFGHPDPRTREVRARYTAVFALVPAWGTT